MMSHINKKIIASLIIFVDFKKAFDSIDTQFIETALDLLGFGERYRKWGKVPRQDKNTYVFLHGFLGDAIKL